MIELRHLRYFIVLAEELHFGRAAERLHIAQPGLSQQIKVLEDEVGVVLFDRNNRRVALTAAGATLLEEGRRALKEVDRAIALTQKAGRGEVGRLRIGAADSAILEIVPVLLREYHSRHPHVDLIVREMSSPDQVAAVRSGDLDVGFIRTPVNTENLVTLTLKEEPIGVFLPEGHRLAKSRTVSLAKLAGEPLVLHPSSRPSWADFMISLCRDAGFEPIIGQEANETATAVSFVAAGLGVTLVPATLEALARSRVIYRPLSAPSPVTRLQLVHTPGLIPPTLKSLISMARKLWPHPA